MRKHPSKHPSGEYTVNVHAYNQIAKILVVGLVRDDITEATFTPAGLELYGDTAGDAWVKQDAADTAHALSPRHGLDSGSLAEYL